MLFGAKLARRHPEKQNSRLLPQDWSGRGCKRLSFERGGESRTQRHRQRLACRRSSTRPSKLKVIPVTLCPAAQRLGNEIS